MKATKTHKSLLKTLPIIGILMAGLTLSPAIAYADKDRSHNKAKYTHDRDYSHHKKDKRRHKKLAYNDHGRLHGKHHKRHRGHKPKHHRNNWRGYTPEHRHNKHTHRGHRSHRHTTYIVNDHHYHALDRLGFMLGIHTGNFDIVFHD